MSAREPDSTILVVDDDRPFATALASALRRRGFRTLLAHTTEEALQEALAFRPSRAVVDLRMPGAGGLHVVAELRRHLPGTRVVVLTGYGSITTAVEAIKLGAVHYLTKPADPEAILAAFEGVTHPTAVTAPAVEGPPPTRAPSLEEVEWEHLQRVLRDCEGNISEAARRLGLHRRSLQRKLARGRPGDPSSS